MYVTMPIDAIRLLMQVMWYARCHCRHHALEANLIFFMLLLAKPFIMSLTHRTYDFKAIIASMEKDE